MTSRAGRLQAFTLLEVMAAVLVLGLIYSVLAEAAIRGLRSEGVSRRRVEASLIADRFLADLEAQLALGVMPETGALEEEVDVYRVGVTVAPFDPTPMLEAIAAAQKELGREPKGPSSDNSMELGGEPQVAPSEDLLAPPRTGEDGRLRRIDVAVRWQDGDREESVLRTTFAFDTTGLEELFPKKGGEATGGDEDGEAANGEEADGTSQPATGKNSGGRNNTGKNNTGRNPRPGVPEVMGPGQSRSAE